jgi:hypothetical protein
LYTAKKHKKHHFAIMHARTFVCMAHYYFRSLFSTAFLFLLPACEDGHSLSSPTLFIYPSSALAHPFACCLPVRPPERPPERHPPIRKQRTACPETSS